MKRIFSTENPSANGKSILLGAMLLVLSFGCSIDQDTTLVDPNLNQVEKSLFAEKVIIQQSPEFKKALETIYSSPNSKINSGGNGAMIVVREGLQWITIYADTDGDGKSDKALDFTVPGGESSIKILPNGLAQFSINSQNAVGAYGQIVGFYPWGQPITEPIYTNNCNPTGKMFGKVTGGYEVWDFSEFGGPVFYFLDYENIQTAEILTFDGKVNDSYKGEEFDEETFEFNILCEEPTVSKNLSIKFLNLMNNKNPKRELKIKLD